MTSLVKQRLRDGKIVAALAMGPIIHHKMVTLAALQGGYHAIWIDLEHPDLTQNQVEVLALACRAHDLDCFARLAPTDYATVMRPLEAGCGGVLSAQIHSVEQAKQVVEWAKFPPQGVRGLFGANWTSQYGNAKPAEHIVEANANTWVGIQIETLGALETVDEIAALDGVDHLFVGPGDLSVALGVPGDSLHEKCIAALGKVSKAARDSGISWGVLPRSREHADTCRELGAQLFAISGDVVAFRLGLKALHETYDAYLEAE
jgi:2-dehydro-3-deoxyglucarate aldolase/4-hydroxy-2-oxoheptanedioate aldolase